MEGPTPRERPWEPPQAPGGPPQPPAGAPGYDYPPQAPPHGYPPPAPGAPGAPGYPPAPPPGGMPAYGYAPPPPSVGPEDMPVRRSYLRIVGFSALSIGLYTLYWFYVTRKQLSRELGTNDRAGLQTAGNFVPILNYFIAHWLWRDISLLRQRVGLPGFDVAPYTAGNVVGSLFGLQFIVYLLIQEKLNNYYDRSRGGRAPDAPYTAGEIAVVVIPLLLFAGLIALVIILAAAGAAGDSVAWRLASLL